MNTETSSFPKYACQLCGSDRKFVETIIDDEFFWSEHEQRFDTNGFSDAFEHTGVEYCAECQEDWTGIKGEG